MSFIIGTAIGAIAFFYGNHRWPDDEAKQFGFVLLVAVLTMVVSLLIRLALEN